MLKLDDPLERGFYEQQAIAERWLVAELKRQKATGLFLRLAASKDKAGIVQLAVAQPEDLLREPYVFEFLKIAEPWQVSETQLEAALCQHLVEYATYKMNSQLCVQKYQLYLPDRDELRREIEQTLWNAGQDA